MRARVPDDSNDDRTRWPACGSVSGVVAAVVLVGALACAWPWKHCALQTSPTDTGPPHHAVEQGHGRRSARPPLRPPMSYSWLFMFMGHSGSTAIVDRFIRHPQIFTPDMEHNFEPLEVRDALSPKRGGGSTSSMVRDPIWSAYNYTARLFTAARAGTVHPEEFAANWPPMGSPRPSVGFKIRPFHILSLPKQWASLVRQHDTRVFWNEDENTMRSVLNHEVSAAAICKLCEGGTPLPINIYKFLKCGRPGACSEAGASQLSHLYNWQARTRSKPPLSREAIDALFPVTIRLDRIAARFAQERRGNLYVAQSLRLLRLPLRSVHYVSYHDFLSGGPVVEEMARHVGVDPALLPAAAGNASRPLTRRPAKSRLCDRIANFDEVCAHFGACPELRWMLDDPERDGCRCMHIGCDASWLDSRLGSVVELPEGLRELRAAGGDLAALGVLASFDLGALAAELKALGIRRTKKRKELEKMLLALGLRV
jgi:hypothetical protein